MSPSCVGVALPVLAVCAVWREGCMVLVLNRDQLLCCCALTDIIIVCMDCCMCMLVLSIVFCVAWVRVGLCGGSEPPWWLDGIVWQRI